MQITAHILHGQRMRGLEFCSRAGCLRSWPDACQFALPELFALCELLALPSFGPAGSGWLWAWPLEFLLRDEPFPHAFAPILWLLQAPPAPAGLHEVGGPSPGSAPLSFSGFLPAYSIPTYLHTHTYIHTYIPIVSIVVPFLVNHFG